MAKRTIQLYFLFSALYALSFSFIGATYVIFLLARGLNLFEVNLVNVVFYLMVFAFEIPTGAIADVFGRKKSFVISCFITAGANFIYAASHSFWGFALAEATAAVGMTFATGAFQAWLVDRLKYFNYAESLKLIFAREQQITQCSFIVGTIIGAYIAEINIALPWIFGGIVFFITGVLAAIILKEEYFARPRFSLKQNLHLLQTTVKTSAAYCRGNKNVLFIMLAGAIFCFATQAPNMQWQPFFAEFLSDKKHLGFISAGIFISIMLGSTVSVRYFSCCNERTGLIIASALSGAFIVATAVCAAFLPALIFFMSHELCRGIYRPIKETYLNNNIPSDKRATIISFEAMALHLGGAAGLITSGLFAEYASISSAWLISGAILAFGSLLLLKK